MLKHLLDETRIEEIAGKLSRPFHTSEIKFKPQVVKGNRALALAYVDVRAIMDRLDGVLGMENWQDDYETLPDHSVVCQLKIRVGGQWISKSDVGSPGDHQSDGGFQLKSAFSDALKRAAVKFGIGRYLYRLPQQWVDYDPVKKQITNPPKLPDWALPPKNIAQAPNVKVPKEKPVTPSRPNPLSNNNAEIIRDGSELRKRLGVADEDLATRGLCPAGSLISYIVAMGEKAGFGKEVEKWNGSAIDFAIREVKEFRKRLTEKESRTAA